jgi:hypothetical protein
MMAKESTTSERMAIFAHSYASRMDMGFANRSLIFFGRCSFFCSLGEEGEEEEEEEWGDEYDVVIEELLLPYVEVARRP